MRLFQKHKLQRPHHTSSIQLGRVDSGRVGPGLDWVLQMQTTPKSLGWGCGFCMHVPHFKVAARAAQVNTESHCYLGVPSRPPFHWLYCPRASVQICN